MNDKKQECCTEMFGEHQRHLGCKMSLIAHFLQYHEYLAENLGVYCQE